MFYALAHAYTKGKSMPLQRPIILLSFPKLLIHTDLYDRESKEGGGGL